jgi:hypothetical protein
MNASNNLVIKGIAELMALTVNHDPAIRNG